MVETAIGVLTNIVVILILGFFINAAAHKLKASGTLFFIVLGIIIGSIARGSSLLYFPVEVIVVFAVVAMSVKLAAYASVIEVTGLKAEARTALSVIVMLVVAALLSLLLQNAFPATFGPLSAPALLFAIIICSTLVLSPDAFAHRNASHTSQSFGLVGTVLAFVIGSALMLSQVDEASSGIIGTALSIAIGLGVGVIAGIVFLKISKSVFLHKISLISMPALSVLGYVIAEDFGGNGAAAAVAIGLMFGSAYLNEKDNHRSFSMELLSTLDYIAYTLLGLSVAFIFSAELLLISILALAIIVAVHYASIRLIAKRNSRPIEALEAALSPRGSAAILLLLYPVAASISSVILIIIALSHIASWIFRYVLEKRFTARP